LLPALAAAKGKAQSGRCLNNLKQLGLATLIYAQDFRNAVQIDAPLEPGVTWGSILSTNQNLKPFDLFVCPTYAPRHFTNWFKTYGVRQDPPPGSASGDFGEILRIDRVSKPVEYLHCGGHDEPRAPVDGAEQY